MSSKLTGKRNRQDNNGFDHDEPSTKRHCSKGDAIDAMQRRREKLFAWNKVMKTEEVQSDNNASKEADEVDSLDAFMVGIETSVQQLCNESLMKINAESQKKVEIDETRVEEPMDQPAGIIIKTGKKVLEQVDHAKADYIAFRKDLYVEVPDVTKMTDEQVAAYRAQLDDIKIRLFFS
jgi:hypothetical protein